MADPNEMIGALLDDLAAEIMVLEAGDLMAYGDSLSRLEQLIIVSEGAAQQGLGDLAEGLKSLMEKMILGEQEDHEQGLKVITDGISLGQGLLRGDSGGEAVLAFLAESGLGKGQESAPEPASQEPGPPEAAPAAEGVREAAPLALEEEPEVVPTEPVPETGEGVPPPTAEEATPEEEEQPSVQVAALAEEPALPASDGDPEYILSEKTFSPEDSELLEGFVTEALEHLESIEVNALVLEDTPEDPEALNSVFRPFHTIKGVSGFLNLADINHLAHVLENLLDTARAGRLLLVGQGVDVILAGVDMLHKMITECSDAAGENRPRRLYNFAALEKRVDAVLAGEEKPSPRKVAEPPPKLGEILVETALVSEEAVGRALETQKTKMPGRQLGEILVHEKAAAPAQVAEGIRTQRAIARSKGPLAQEVKINIQKLDFLLDMVGELVIAQSMVQANPNVARINDRKLSADLSQLSRITSDLQRTTMAMRMVPIKQTFKKMVRVVRDTAKKQNKKVKLELEGEGTEIDRNMVEKFYDPLMHMVRNSVDHGIEPTVEARRAAGKPEEGLLVLSAYHKGGAVCIEIRDDGQGLNTEKIIAKAIENGLIEDAEGMTDAETFHLIMQPGFSTAEKVTEISGRGVGMDVVQKAIDQLRGKVEISSTMGEGTTFTIALPLTLAIIDGMVVQVGGERFILPTVSVVESLRPTREEYNTVAGKGEMIMIRGTLLPLIRLGQLVEVKSKCENPWDALVVVVEHHGQKRCLMVDKLIGRQEVVIKSLGEDLKKVKVLAGGAILGDGRVGLILDVEGLYKSQEGK